MQTDRWLFLLAVSILLSSRASAATLTVLPGGDFQAALNVAQPGDTIVLTAGATYATGDGFVLRNKGAATQPIKIQSSDLAGLPASGHRVKPTDAAHMPRLESTADAVPVLRAEAGAHHYELVGIEFALAPGRWTYVMVQLGEGNERRREDQPHHITLDRCYVHGDPVAEPGTKRGIALEGANLEILNSHISDIHTIGQDSQAIGCFNGAGPFRIINNYLEGAGENVIFGGSDPSIVDLVPSDIEIRSNHFYKPLRWLSSDPSYEGHFWSVKNIFELKNAERVVVEGNIFENNWAQGQSGTAILFTPRNQNGACPWCRIKDVTFRYNIIRHSGSGIGLLFSDDGQNSGPMENVLIRDNLFEDINAARFGKQLCSDCGVADGFLFQFFKGRVIGRNVQVNHNTALHASSGGAAYAIAGDEAHIGDGFSFDNNLVTYGSYGFFGSGVSGTPALAAFFTNWTMTGNTMVGGGSAGEYPAGNSFAPALTSVGFTDLAAGDYQLAPSSPYYRAGTDGQDVGANIEAVLAATCGAVTGVPRTTCSTLPAPTLNLPSVLPLNAKISATMPPGYTIISYSWSISPQDRPTASPSTRAPLHTGHTIFPTPSGVASLAPLGLDPGNYLVEVVAIDSQGRRSPAAGGFVTLVSGELAGAVVFPNPWRADRHAATPAIIFAGLAANTSIKIFTVSGHLVRKLPSSSSSTTWNLRTDSGDLVASGIYIYLLTTDAGSKLTGKLVIIQ